jgi:hypothetical protein
MVTGVSSVTSASSASGAAVVARGPIEGLSRSQRASPTALVVIGPSLVPPPLLRLPFRSTFYGWCQQMPRTGGRSPNPPQPY